MTKYFPNHEICNLNYIIHHHQSLKFAIHLYLNYLHRSLHVRLRMFNIHMLIYCMRLTKFSYNSINIFVFGKFHCIHNIGQSASIFTLVMSIFGSLMEYIQYMVNQSVRQSADSLSVYMNIL